MPVVARLEDPDAVVVRLDIAGSRYLPDAHAAPIAPKNAIARALETTMAALRLERSRAAISKPVNSRMPATSQTIRRVPSQEISQNPVVKVPTMEPTVDEA